MLNVVLLIGRLEVAWDGLGTNWLHLLGLRLGLALQLEALERVLVRCL